MILLIPFDLALIYWSSPKLEISLLPLPCLSFLLLPDHAYHFVGLDVFLQSPFLDPIFVLLGPNEISVFTISGRNC